jgi:hypothetical protein
VEEKRTWELEGWSLYFRDPDRHLIELATPGTSCAVRTLVMTRSSSRLSGVILRRTLAQRPGADSYSEQAAMNPELESMINRLYHPQDADLTRDTHRDRH